MAGPTPSRSSATPLRSGAAPLLCLLALIGIAFAPALRGEFLGEDVASLAHDGVSVGATSGVEPRAPRPLEHAVVALAHHFAKGRPLAFHIVSLFVHLGATTAVFLLARRLTRQTAIALLAAALFGLHPVQAESVARISALHAPLAALFVLLALHVFAGARQRGASDWKAYATSGALFVCGLLASETAIALIPMALVLDLAMPRSEPAPRSRSAQLAPHAIYGVCALVWLALRSAATTASIPLAVDDSRLWTLRAELFGRALERLVWPFGSGVFPPFRPVIAWSDPSLVMGLCGAAVLAGTWIWLHRGGRGVALAAVLLIPAALVQPLIVAHASGAFPLTAEQLYLATTGLALLAALVASTKAGVVVLSAVAIAFAAQTYRRTQIWKNDLTLLGTAVAETPDSPTLQWRLGRAQLRESTARGDHELLTSAGRTFQTALDLLARAQKGDRSIFATSDDFLQSNLGLGWSVLFQSERDPDGIDDTAQRVFEMVAARYPESAEAQTALGVSALALGRLEESERAFGRALSLRPGYPEALHNLGQLRVRRGDWRGAAQAFEQALRSRPDHLDDLLSLSRALAEGGEEERALATLERAGALAPDDPGPLVIRGTIEARRGALDSALSWVDRALARAPDDGEALLLRGKILLARGELFAARRALGRAAERLPRSFEAHYNLAALYLKNDEPAEALPHLVQAYALRPTDAASDELRRSLVDIGIQDAETFWRLATIDADRGQPKLAEDWLGRALERDPEHGPSHLLLGLLRKQRGDIDGAAAALQHACRSMPQSYPAHFTLGMMLVDAGRTNEGLGFLERALELATQSEGQNPESAAALDGLRQRIESIKDKTR